jgi:hypothetical protein
MVSPSPGLNHGCKTCSISSELVTTGLDPGGTSWERMFQLDFAGSMPFQTTLPGRYHGGDSDSTASWASLWIRFPAGAGKFQNCTLAILRPCARLQSRSWWFLPSLTRAIESGVEHRDLTLATSGYALVDADRRQLVRPITPVHRSGHRNCPSFGVRQLRIVRRIAAYPSSLLGAVQGSVICHCYGGIDEYLRGFFSIPGASRLCDACFVTDQPPE